MQNSRRAVPPRNLAAYLLRGALSATKGQAYLLETPPRDKGPGDLTGATQLVKESDSRPRRTFYTPPPLVSNRDETEACRPRPDAITRTPRAESRNFSILWPAIGRSPDRLVRVFDFRWENNFYTFDKKKSYTTHSFRIIDLEHCLLPFSWRWMGCFECDWWERIEHWIGDYG